MRSEEEILAGTLVLQFGEERVIRVLHIAEEREWLKGLTNVVGSISNLEFDQKDPDSMVRVVGAIAFRAGDGILDLVVAYDVDGILGGREWLEHNATSEQVYAALRQILEVVAPFVRDAQTAINYVQMLLKAAPSAPANSSSGPLPIGTSARKRSKAA